MDNKELKKTNGATAYDIKADIKSCPFCKSSKVAIVILPFEPISYIECLNCNARGSFKDSTKEAKKVWNKIKRGSYGK